MIRGLLDTFLRIKWIFLTTRAPHRPAHQLICRHCLCFWHCALLLAPVLVHRIPAYASLRSSPAPCAVLNCARRLGIRNNCLISFSFFWQKISLIFSFWLGWSF